MTYFRNLPKNLQEKRAKMQTVFRDRGPYLLADIVEVFYIEASPLSWKQHQAHE